MSSAIEKAIAEIRASKPLAKHAKQILQLVRPHIRFEPRPGEDSDDRPGASRLGGEPDLPAGTPWPIGSGFEGEAPMEFIAQIDLDAITRRDIDGLLPKTGVLAFFIAQDYGGSTVVYGDHDKLVRARPPGRRSARPRKFGGIDVEAAVILPPLWSEFVSSTMRSERAWNSRTNEWGKGTTLVELSREGTQAYDDIYDRWLEVVGYAQHGMLGYERKMESVQRADELALLRIDCHNFSDYDFVELVSIYWFITATDLAARRFDKVEAHCGSTI